MSDNTLSPTETELLELVRSLQNRVDALEVEIKSLRLVQAQNVPEETLVAIAAAVAAYLGHRAKRRQPRFTTSSRWQSATRASQHSHTPLPTR